MTNYVTCEAQEQIPDLWMSNSVTSTFISVMCLATSRLATTKNQQRLAVWLGGRDQTVLGLGCVGFDLAELPWRAETFTHDREFLIFSTSQARAQLGWHVLSYTPDTPEFHAKLAAFQNMLERFALVQGLPDELKSPETFTKCQKHDVFRHDLDCVVCNDS